MSDQPNNKVVTMGGPPIIVIKKKKGHGGHHGGAWKVAYADFVTAMMALFIVLWLLNSNQDVRKAIGGYFKDPTGVGTQAGSAQSGSGETLSLKKEDLEKLRERIEQAIKQAPELDKLRDQVDMAVTGEGLRIELLETDKGAFFENGSPTPTKIGRNLILKLAEELGKMPNSVMIEGHTDSTPYVGGLEYSNWELSADRANAARRLMQTGGLRPGQVKQVRGFADQNLRKPKEPNNPSNRRISMIVQYTVAPATPRKESKAAEGGHEKPPAEHGKPAPAKESKASEGHEKAPAEHGTPAHEK